MRERQSFVMKQRKFSKTDLFLLVILESTALLLVCVIVPDGYCFGSKIDWYCQHVTIADYMRRHFYATGNLLPDFSGLGGGSNFYGLSYYGLFRPDVILAYLSPKCSVSSVIQGYAIFEIMLGIMLLYYWLRRKGLKSLSCLAGGFLYLCANCLFQAHRQIMFVNYLPFLILALIAMDAMAGHRHSRSGILLQPYGRLSAAMFLIILHSYYFFPSCFVVCMVYLWFLLSNGKGKTTPSNSRTGILRFWKYADLQMTYIWKKFFLSTMTAVGLSMVLILPTGLAILENKKDAGSTSLAHILSVNPTLDSLLYSPYGCGLTLFCLFALLLGIRRKKTRKLSALLLLFFSFDFIYWLLNGTLYVRPKSLIPFLPLLVFLAAMAFEDISGGFPASPVLAILCLIPAVVQLLYKSHSLTMDGLIKLDGLLLMLLVCGSFLLWKIGKKYNVYRILRKGYVNVCLFLLAFFLPAGICIEKAGTEKYYPEKSDTEILLSESDIVNAGEDSSARLDILKAPMSNSNKTVTGLQNKSTIYSSVSSSIYNQFYYDILKMPVSCRNRVAMTAGANPFQEYLMGVRYLITTGEKLPAGYLIKSKKGGDLLLENKNVLPLAYGSTALISEAEFDRLMYPQTLDTLANRTVVPEKVPVQRYSSKIKKYSLPENFMERQSVSENKAVIKTLPERISENEVLLLSFDLDYSGRRDVSITINGIKNCLSGSTAPYPNHNTTFTYMISDQNGLEKLDIQFSKGNYRIYNVCAYRFSLTALAHPGISLFRSEPSTGEKTMFYGNEILSGTINMKESGYFVTSYAWAKGYRATVDGKSVKPVRINKAFVGFPLAKGEHKVTLKFLAPGKTAGLALSIGTFAYVILCAVLYSLRVLRSRGKGNYGRHEVPVLSGNRKL